MLLCAEDSRMDTAAQADEQAVEGKRQVLTHLRRRLHYPQAALAKRLRCDRSRISLFENGHVSLHEHELATIERILTDQLAELRSAVAEDISFEHYDREDD